MDEGRRNRMRARVSTYRSKRTKEGMKLDVLLKAALSFAKEQKSRECRAFKGAITVSCRHARCQIRVSAENE
jgi:hypothetical protein